MKIDHPLRGLRSTLLQNVPEPPIVEFSNVGIFNVPVLKFLFGTRRILKTGSGTVVSNGPLACLTVPQGKTWIVENISYKVDTLGDTYTFRPGCYEAGSSLPIKMTGNVLNVVSGSSDEQITGLDDAEGLVLNAGDFIGPWVWNSVLGFGNTLTVWACVVEVDPF